MSGVSSAIFALTSKRLLIDNVFSIRKTFERKRNMACRKDQMKCSPNVDVGSTRPGIHIVLYHKPSTNQSTTVWPIRTRYSNTFSASHSPVPRLTIWQKRHTVCRGPRAFWGTALCYRKFQINNGAMNLIEFTLNLFLSRFIAWKRKWFLFASHKITSSVRWKVAGGVEGSSIENMPRAPRNVNPALTQPQRGRSVPISYYWQ